MARRKRKDEEEAEWDAPEFDEVDFMRREIYGAKAAVVVVGWAVLGALVSFGVSAAGVHWAAAFFAGLATFAGLRFVFPILGVRSAAFKRRDWIGHGSTYFFSWLAFWILLLNAPFTDFTAPAIHSILVGSHATGADLSSISITCQTVTAGAVSVESNNTLYISFRATDNMRIGSTRVTTVPGSSYVGQLVANLANPCTTSDDFYPASTFAVSFGIIAPNYAVAIDAWDAGGRHVAVSFNVNIP